ncbi:MAG TPA: heat-shock protein, partial [Anaerolineales bacterium]|nr:heat-shock protein [Anaerolineales bacterium]
MIPRKIAFIILIAAANLLAGCSIIEEAFAPLPTLPPTAILPTAAIYTPTPWPTPMDTATPTTTPTPK